MAQRREVLAFGCRDDALDVFRRASGEDGPALRTVRKASEFAHDAVASGPLAVLLGVGAGSLANLDLISVIHAVRADLPVVVIAEEDSLEVERRARQERVFYYLVHPLEPEEVKALLEDLDRRGRK